MICREWKPEYLTISVISNANRCGRQGSLSSVEICPWVFQGHISTEIIHMERKKVPLELVYFYILSRPVCFDKLPWIKQIFPTMQCNIEGLNTMWCVWYLSCLITVPGAGVGELEVIIQDPAGKKGTVEQQLEDKGNSTYRCSYKPTLEGTYTIYITFGGIPIPRSPYTVTVGQGESSGLHSGPYIVLIITHSAWVPLSGQKRVKLYSMLTSVLSFLPTFSYAGQLSSLLSSLL